MPVIALAGNPNVGKSTLFNALTGLSQHTGNWPGKTVELAQGRCTFKGEEYCIADLPGTYSLVSYSPEEQVAGDFLRSGEADCAVAVCDATSLERSLILVLQMMEICPKMVVCVNLWDEAKRAHTEIDADELERQLGVPVVRTSAKNGEGTEKLLETVRGVCQDFLPVQPQKLGCGIGAAADCSDELARKFVLRAREIAETAVRSPLKEQKPSLTRRLDRFLLNGFWGSIVMLLLLLLVFWLTIEGANYPSMGLQWCFDRLGELLYLGAAALHLPDFLRGMLLDGVYATLGRVISVMLPPMAIFFPLFTLLEDFGYLPRMAFLLDESFRKSGACGKQSLTMCMGFGCNAAGVIGCRIIHSPRERLMAILTNAFVPCNGRFPALIFLIGLSFSGGSSILGALILTGFVLLSVLMTLGANTLLHRTALRGETSAFLMEMPPYRKPRIGQVLIRSLLDRTLFVLGRAAVVAAPAGLVIWLLANVQVNGSSLLQILSSFLEIPGMLLGLNGAVLLAFILGSPANELVLPVLLMILTAGTGFAGSSAASMGEILINSGWNWKLSVCTILFFMFHWPCTTTLLTIYHETRSKKQTALAALLPTAFGVVLCFLVNLILPV